MNEEAGTSYTGTRIVKTAEYKIMDSLLLKIIFTTLIIFACSIFTYKFHYKARKDEKSGRFPLPHTLFFAPINYIIVKFTIGENINGFFFDTINSMNERA